MTGEKSQPPHRTVLVGDSINGIAIMAPSNVGVAKLSIEGISRLNPVSAAPSPVAAPAAPSAPSPSAEKK